MAVKINIGDKFIHWTILEELPNHVSPGGTSRKMYKCQCDCGTIRDVSVSLLRTGKSTSCGCRGSYLKPKDIYQEWTVIEKVKEKNSHGSQFYLCQCSCGILRKVRMADLLNGKSKNCGHSRFILSQGAKAIKQFLTNNNYDFYQEYTFLDFPNRRYDFALYNKEAPTIIARLIEFDGEQHCLNSRSSWHSEDLIKRDKEKNQYALTHDIPLIRIPYYKNSIEKDDIFSSKFQVKKEGMLYQVMD